MNYKFRQSIDPSEINKVMEVASSFGGNEEELTRIKAYIETELVELGENRILFILSQGIKTVGIVQLLTKRADEDPDLADGKSTAHVHALQIAKDHQRKGLGLMMMQELEVFAEISGFTRLTLGVDGDNDGALKLYEKLGYKRLKEAEGRETSIPLFYLFKDL